MLTQSEVLERFKKAHGDKYIYDKVQYKGQNYKIKIYCCFHKKYFEQLPYLHWQGNGCKDCGIERSQLKQIKTFENLIEEIHNAHGNKYGLSKIIYKNLKSKITIECLIHGKFKIIPSCFLKGQGCPKCSSKGSSEYDNQKFIEKSISTHGHKYDYKNVNYINNYTKVDIICNKHGKFSQLPSNHWAGNGCPKCNNSRGEDKIRIFLDDNKIEYIQQKSFEDCRNNKTNRKLFFDFYLHKFNLLIEFQGQQHYQPIRLKKMNMSVAIDAHERTKYTDQIKTQYCIDNNIELLRIPYTEFKNIETISMDRLINGKTPLINYPIIKHI